jgi:hypothetical protein
MRNMTATRLIWILWCLAWAAFWTFAAVGTFGITLVFTIASLLMILVPIGKPRRKRGEPASDHA